MSTVTRRALLEGLLAALAAASFPLPARADHAVERQAPIDHLREKAEGFDVVEFARQALVRARLDRWTPDVEALFADREHLRGLRSLHELGKDPAFVADASAL